MKVTLKKAMIALVIIAFAFVLSSWYLYNHVPLVAFKPVYLGDDQRLETQTTPMSEQEVDRVIATLEGYRQTYHRQDEVTVLITPKLSQDQELIWNYTTKSRLK